MALYRCNTGESGIISGEFMKAIDLKMPTVSKKWKKIENINSGEYIIKSKGKYNCWNFVAKTPYNFVANRIAALPEILELLENLNTAFESDDRAEIEKLKFELTKILHKAKHGE